MKRRILWLACSLLVAATALTTTYNPTFSRYVSTDILNFNTASPQIIQEASQAFDIVFTAPILVTPGNDHVAFNNEEAIPAVRLQGAQVILTNAPSGYYAFFCRGARGGRGSNFITAWLGGAGMAGTGGHGAAVSGVVYIPPAPTGQGINIMLRAGRGGIHAPTQGVSGGENGVDWGGGGVRNSTGDDNSMAGGGGGYSGIFVWNGASTIPSTEALLKNAAIAVAGGGGGGGGTSGTNVPGGSSNGTHGGDGGRVGNSGTGAGSTTSANGSLGSGGGGGGAGGSRSGPLSGSGDPRYGGDAGNITANIRDGNPNGADPWHGIGGGGGRGCRGATGGGGSGGTATAGGANGSTSTNNANRGWPGDGMSGGEAGPRTGARVRGGAGGGGWFGGGSGGWEGGNVANGGGQSGSGGGGGGGSSYLRGNISSITSLPDNLIDLLPIIAESDIVPSMLDSTGLAYDTSAANGYVWIMYLGTQLPTDAWLTN